jgi:hypothetical protein
MSTRCIVLRGVAKEVEDAVNELLEEGGLRVVQLGQSESGNQITLTLIVEELGRLQ